MKTAIFVRMKSEDPDAQKARRLTRNSSLPAPGIKRRKLFGSRNLSEASQNLQQKRGRGAGNTNFYNDLKFRSF